MNSSFTLCCGKTLKTEWQPLQKLKVFYILDHIPTINCTYSCKTSNTKSRHSIMKVSSKLPNSNSKLNYKLTIHRSPGRCLWSGHRTVSEWCFLCSCTMATSSLLHTGNSCEQSRRLTAETSTYVPTNQFKMKAVEELIDFTVYGWPDLMQWEFVHIIC